MKIVKYSFTNCKWKPYSLRDILTKVANPVAVQPDCMYRQIGIRSHGKGLFHKEAVTGQEIGNKSVFYVEPDCLVVNIVFAWERAVARTTENEKGTIASHRFPMYRVKSDVADLDFLVYYFLTDAGNQVMKLASPGGAGRNKTLGQQAFLNSVVYLPPMEEQKKIASLLLSVDARLSAQEAYILDLEMQRKELLRRIFAREIRFQDEDGQDFSNWKECSLSSLVTRILRKNTENQSDRPLTISAEHGLVDQTAFFKKIVASKDLTEYYLLHKGEFAYNKSMTREYPVGAVKRLNLYKHGAVSPLYICFVPTTVDSDFLAHYFESTYWHGQVKAIAQEGARNHGLLNVSAEGFFNTMHMVPSLPEQRRIADFLTALDGQLDNERTLMEDWKLLKKGLLQRMFI